MLMLSAAEGRKKLPGSSANLLQGKFPSWPQRWQWVIPWACE